MKKQNYKKLYREIFLERAKEDEYGSLYVICEHTGVRIYESEIKVHNFSHIKSKGSCPELKHDKTNIEIVAMSVHGQEHCSGKFNNHLPIK